MVTHPPRTVPRFVRTVSRAMLLAGLVLALVGVSARPASGTHEVKLAPPVPGPVIRGFEPPEVPYGPGHRGVDFAARPGQAVLAPAGGVVSFAGAVARQLHVTIDHQSGFQVTLSFLHRLGVRRGDVVRAGQVVAQAAGLVHLGVRDPAGRYVDPLRLLGTGSAVLVPVRLGRWWEPLATVHSS